MRDCPIGDFMKLENGKSLIDMARKMCIRDRPSESVFPCAIALDCGDTTRLGAASPLFYAAETRIVIDHHHTNTGYGDFNLVRSYSATGLILFELMGLSLIHI